MYASGDESQMMKVVQEAMPHIYKQPNEHTWHEYGFWENDVKML